MRWPGWGKREIGVEKISNWGRRNLGRRNEGRSK